MLECLYVHHMLEGARGGQEKVSESLELVWQAVVSCHLNTGNPKQLCKSSKCF